jgi:hypothetical protein
LLPLACSRAGVFALGAVGLAVGLRDVAVAPIVFVVAELVSERVS